MRVDEGPQVVGLLLALAHLHHISQILAHLLKHVGAHLHLALKEAEQGILCVAFFSPVQSLKRNPHPECL